MFWGSSGSFFSNLPQLLGPRILSVSEPLPNWRTQLENRLRSLISSPITEYLEAEESEIATSTAGQSGIILAGAKNQRHNCSRQGGGDENGDSHPQMSSRLDRLVVLSPLLFANAWRCRSVQVSVCSFAPMGMEPQRCSDMTSSTRMLC